MGIRFDQDSINRLVAGLNGYTDKVKAGLFVVADAGSKKMESYAKTNAKWTDRTSNARQTLRGHAQWEGNKLVCGVHHGVEYGLWLEIANQKKYAVLDESLQAHVSEIISSYKRVVSK